MLVLVMLVLLVLVLACVHLFPTFDSKFPYESPQNFHMLVLVVLVLLVLVLVVLALVVLALVVLMLVGSGKVLVVLVVHCLEPLPAMYLFCLLFALLSTHFPLCNTLVVYVYEEALWFMKEGNWKMTFKYGLEKSWGRVMVMYRVQHVFEEQGLVHHG